MAAIEVAIESFLKTYLADEAAKVAGLRIFRSPEAEPRAKRLDNMEICYHALFVLGGFAEMSNENKTRFTSFAAQEIGLQISDAVYSGTS